MPVRLDTRDADFSERLRRALAGRGDARDGLEEDVRAILRRVREGGDAALVEFSRRFDRLEVAAAADLRVPPEETARALDGIPADLRSALERAIERIHDYHARQMPEDRCWKDDLGVTLGWRWRPVEAVGIYVPGGLASYPSSVLMNAVPARVAGVERIVMAVPAPDGRLNPLVLAAARLLDIDEIWRIGGAQAVAALAFGTESIVPVDKIVGPGNAWVAEAKRQVFGRVGIDAIAGPSEILVLADRRADPEWIAADLLSQAEHGDDAQAILIADDDDLIGRVEAALARQLGTLPRADIASASWERHGLVIRVRDLAGEAPAIVDRIAPEHLELMVAEPQALAARIRHAGAIFLGDHAPEAFGDYLAGPDHVLPTDRTARFASGLSVFDFLKRTSLIGATPAALAALGDDVVRLARAEGLEAHARSVAVRLAPDGETRADAKARRERKQEEGGA